MVFKKKTNISATKIGTECLDSHMPGTGFCIFSDCLTNPWMCIKPTWEIPHHHGVWGKATSLPQRPLLFQGHFVRHYLPNFHLSVSLLPVCTGNFRFLPSQMSPDGMIPYPTVYILQSLFQRKGEKRKKSWCAISLNIPRGMCSCGTSFLNTERLIMCHSRENEREESGEDEGDKNIEIATLQWIFSMDQALG